jgi:hypothetical protein
LHSHVAPPWARGMVWSKSQRAAGRAQPGRYIGRFGW